ncbi:MAG: GNAT family N-acetyltransferase [Bacteroides fragilis]|nr:GNAT family N-acetyltransferase [Bacteroides fragilis]
MMAETANRELADRLPAEYTIRPIDEALYAYCQKIDTKKEYRRRGLATVCGARLILECLDRGLYPSWDAQNPWSVVLAQKLGYHFDREYTAYEIQWAQRSADERKE